MKRLALLLVLALAAGALLLLQRSLRQDEPDGGGVARPELPGAAVGQKGVGMPPEPPARTVSRWSKAGSPAASRTPSPPPLATAVQGEKGLVPFPPWKEQPDADSEPPSSRAPWPPST